MTDNSSPAGSLSCLREGAAVARPLLMSWWRTGGVLAVSPIAVHEAGHCVVARYLGRPLAGATIIPNGDFGGLTFPPGEDPINVTGSAIREDAERQCDDARGLMPLAGERRDCAASWVVNAQLQVTGCLAGFAAEELAGVDRRELESTSTDVHVAALYARSVVLSDAAVPFLMAACRADAAQILKDHWAAVEAVAAALDERKTLNGVEIDTVIYQAEQSAMHETELRRREHMADMAARAKEVNCNG
jgi:hypothetical protein